MLLSPILELSRTTYFDSLKDYRTESGDPSGELKISEVPELSGKEDGESHRERRKINEVLERSAILYGGEQLTTNVLKGSMSARAAG